MYHWRRYVRITSRYFLWRSRFILVVPRGYPDIPVMVTRYKRLLRQLGQYTAVATATYQYYVCAPHVASQLCAQRNARGLCFMKTAEPKRRVITHTRARVVAHLRVVSSVTASTKVHPQCTFSSDHRPAATPALSNVGPAHWALSPRLTVGHGLSKIS